MCINRPITTLFMLMSVDGKISTGATDALDFDQDLSHIKGIGEGLQQYYDIEQTTDLWSMNSGRVQAKMGVNEMPFPDKSPVSFVLIDNHHLTGHGIRWFCARSKTFVLITTNPEHPAFQVQEDNLHIIRQQQLDLRAALQALYSDYGCIHLTIQTGGTLNGLILREKLFDYIDVIVAPLLVGGSETSTLIDGKSLMSVNQLNQLGVLELIEVQPLQHSYLRLRYKKVS